MAVSADTERVQGITVEEYYDNRRLFFANTFWLVFGGAAASFGLNTAQSLMPLHMANVGLNAEQISLIMAIRGWVGMPLVLYMAYLSDHWQGKMGRRLPFLAISLPFILLGMAFFPYMRTVLSCLIMYSVFTFFVQVKFDTYPFLIYDIAKKASWGKVNGFNVVVSAIGVWMGQTLLMPMVDVRGEKYVYMLGAAFVGLFTLLTILFMKEPPIRSATPPRFNPMPVILGALKIGFKDRRNIWLFVAFGLICGPGIAFNYIPLQAKVNLGMTDGEIGRQILQYGTLVGVVFAFFMGWTIDKIGAAKSIAIGYVFGIIAVFIGFNPSSAGQLAVAFVLLMAASNFMYMAGSIFVASCVSRENLASFSACNGSVNLFIQACVMQIAGILITRVFAGNYGFAFILSAILTTAGVPLFFWFERVWKAARVEETEMEAGTSTASIAEGVD